MSLIDILLMHVLIVIVAQETLFDETGAEREDPEAEVESPIKQ